MLLNVPCLSSNTILNKQNSLFLLFLFANATNLLSFNDNLFLIIPFFKFDLCIYYTFWFIFWTKRKKSVLPANKTNYSNSDTSIYIIKILNERFSPKTDLCGTPHSIFMYSDILPANCTFFCWINLNSCL